jgi:hypothetical protein
MRKMKKILDLWVFLNAALLYLLIFAVCKTVRFDIHGEELVEAEKHKGSNVLFAVWHQASFVMFYLYRNKRACVITTPEVKGKILGKVAEWMGYINITLPLDSDKFDAARGFARMLKTIRAGHDAVIAVDGPKGPLYDIKPGVYFLSEKAGVPIITVGVRADRKLTLFWRWDKYFIPLPFSKVAINAKRHEQDLRTELMAAS